MTESAVLALRAALDRRQDAGPAGVALYNVLYDAIVQGDIPPGQALSEADLARRLSTSRQLVREAFIKLAERKLLTILPQRGTYVNRISPQRVRAAQWVREAIEVRIVEELARSSQPALIAELDGLIAQQRMVSPGDYRGFQQLDDAFHRALALAGDHEFAWSVIEQAKAQTDRVRFLSLESRTPFDLLANQHGAIVEAIATGNPLAAANAVRAHLGMIFNTLPDIVQSHPEAFEGTGEARRP